MSINYSHPISDNGCPLNLVATCPVWQHVYLSLAESYYDLPLDERRQYSPGFFPDISLGGVDIFPALEDGYATAFSNGLSRRLHIFKIQVGVHELVDWSTWTMAFRQNSRL